MSLQWTLIATFLYSEIGIVTLLLLPFISPKMWQRCFKSKFAKAISSQGNTYFMVFIAILVLFFFDSIREVYKYTMTRQMDNDGHAHLDAEMQHSMKLFRAQRNFYIAGFALFLSFVIRRLSTLIMSQATLLAQCEASMKQAQSATQAAQKLLKDQDKNVKTAGEVAQNEGNFKREEFEHQIVELEENQAKLKLERDHAKKDLESMRKQAESVTQEYDRLNREHEKLQKAFDKAVGHEGSKKDE